MRRKHEFRELRSSRRRQARHQHIETVKQQQAAGLESRAFRRALNRKRREAAARKAAQARPAARAAGKSRIGKAIARWKRSASR